MIYLLWISMFLITYVCGRGFYCISDRQELSSYDNADCILTGTAICICIAGLAHMTSLFLKWNFSKCILLMDILYLTIFAVAGAVCLYDRFKRRRAVAKLYKGAELNRVAYYVGFVTVVVILIQFVMIQVNEHVYLNGDMTVETANTFLYTNGIYTINPLTGREYTGGVPLRIRILCLPSLYAFLAHTFHMDTVEVVWQAVPAFVLIGTYMAYFSISKLLFPRNAQRRNIFLVLVAFLMTVGDYMYGMDGFLLLQSGFRGVAIRALVLLPYTISLTMRRKWLPVLLCMAAEVCIVWTLYGAGVCLVAALGVGIAGRFIRKRDSRMRQGA